MQEQADREKVVLIAEDRIYVEVRLRFVLPGKGRFGDEGVDAELDVILCGGNE